MGSVRRSVEVISWVDTPMGLMGALHCASTGFCDPSWQSCHPISKETCLKPGKVGNVSAAKIGDYEITTTGDKIKMTDVYKNNGSMRKVEVDGAECWVPTPSSSERKLKKAAGNAC